MVFILKIMEIDRKRNKLVIHVDSIDDFYYLLNFIRKGDVVTAKTTRKIQVGGEDGDRVRVPMIISIIVEKIGFQEFADRIRIKGRIIDGPQDLISIGSYHTLNIGLGDTFELERKAGLSDFDINYLKKVEKMKKSPALILVAISDEEASIGVLTSVGLRIISNVNNNTPSKQRSSPKEITSTLHMFFRKISDIVEETLEKHLSDIIIVAGPGFVKEHFSKYIRERIKKKKIYVFDISNATVNGLYEIIKRGIPERVLKEHRVVEETKIIDELLSHLGKNDGLVVIGLEDTYKAVEYGVAKKVLVSSSKLRELDGEDRDKFLDMLRRAENYNMKIFFISDLHPPGEQFKRMGGIAAILRYKVDL